MLVKKSAPEPLKGYIEYSAFNYKERLDVASEMNIAIKDGEAELKGDKAVEAAKKMYETLEKRVKTVAVSFEDKEFKSLDDLGYFQEGSELIQELQADLLGGVRLGNG